MSSVQASSLSTRKQLLYSYAVWHRVFQVDPRNSSSTKGPQKKKNATACIWASSTAFTKMMAIMKMIMMMMMTTLMMKEMVNDNTYTLEATLQQRVQQLYFNSSHGIDDLLGFLFFSQGGSIRPKALHTITFQQVQKIPSKPLSTRNLTWTWYLHSS